MSFTTAGLLKRETILVASVYMDHKDWNLTQQSIMTNNSLQMKTENSRRRVFSEIKSRLECLSDSEKRVLCSANSQDINIILWLALCRRYQFIGNFAKAVLREKFITLQKYIDFSDYAIFVEREATFHPEILKLRNSTSNRLRQMLFQFMRNCDLLNRDNIIQPVIFSSEIEKLFENGNCEEIQYFPVVQKMVIR